MPKIIIMFVFRFILAFIRLIWVILSTFVCGSGVVIESLLKGKSYAIGFKYAGWWARSICWGIGFEIYVKGQKPDLRAIIMPNHRSYADIFVFMAQNPSAFVAKAELRKWPLIGYCAEAAGMIFVNRSSNESRKQTLFEMKKRLEKGFSVTIFPEGTTFLGSSVKDFKMGSFKLAAEGYIPIVPAAIDYAKATDAWVGKEYFVPHFFRVFGHWKTKVTIAFGEVLTSDDATFLHDNAKAFVVNSLKEMQESKIL